MSRARQFLTLMADGRQYTNADLCQITGLSKRQVDSVIGQLRNSGRAETFPVTHQITLDGAEALKGGRFCKPRKERAEVQAPEPVNTTESAIRSRPALQALWQGAGA